MAHIDYDEMYPVGWWKFPSHRWITFEIPNGFFDGEVIQSDMRLNIFHFKKGLGQKG